MAESRNHVGVAYSLTVIAPVLAGRGAEAQAAIEALPAGPASPLAALPGLHFSRIHVVDDLVFQGPQQRRREHLRSPQLVEDSARLDPEAFAAAYERFLVDTQAHL